MLHHVRCGGCRSPLIIPIPFNKEHKNMLAHCKRIDGIQNGQVAINPRFNKHFTSFRIAVEKGEK